MKDAAYQDDKLRHSIVHVAVSESSRFLTSILSPGCSPPRPTLHQAACSDCCKGDGGRLGHGIALDLKEIRVKRGRGRRRCRRSQAEHIVRETAGGRVSKADLQEALSRRPEARA